MGAQRTCFLDLLLLGVAFQAQDFVKVTASQRERREEGGHQHKQEQRPPRDALAHTQHADSLHKHEMADTTVTS